MADNILPIGTVPATAGSANDLPSALPVLSLGIRAGSGQPLPLGYAQSIARTHTRKVEGILQIELCWEQYLGLRLDHHSQLIVPRVQYTHSLDFWTG